MQSVSCGVYKHYKGNLYTVIGSVMHSETLEKMVLYTPLNPNDTKEQILWVRPLDMFMETIETNGEKIQRFTKL